MKNRSILAVLAHPDDESFGMGGTLALYARRNVEVTLVCATQGEAGEVDEEHLKGFNSIGDVRSAELHCAAQILGLKEVIFLGYRDSGMPGSADNQHPQALINHSVGEVATRLVAIMRKIKPEIVLTFDPNGGYRHPDHIHIHQATVMAYDLAAKADFRSDLGMPHSASALYFHTMPHAFLKVVVVLLKILGRDARRFGRNSDIDLEAIVEVDFPVHARINIRPVMRIKDRAGACHLSQGGGSMRKGVLGWMRNLLGGTETFMRADPPPAVGEKVRRDLFLS